MRKPITQHQKLKCIISRLKTHWSDLLMVWWLRTRYGTVEQLGMVPRRHPGCSRTPRLARQGQRAGEKLTISTEGTARKKQRAARPVKRITNYRLHRQGHCRGQPLPLRPHHRTNVLSWMSTLMGASWTAKWVFGLVRMPSSRLILA